MKISHGILAIAFGWQVMFPVSGKELWFVGGIWCLIGVLSITEGLLDKWHEKLDEQLAGLEEELFEETDGR